MPALETVTARIAGLGDWQPVSIEIGLALDEVAREFDMKLAIPPSRRDAVLEGLRKGPEIRLYAGADLVLTGHVEKISPRLQAEEGELSVSGRSRTGDMVDGAAVSKTGEYKGKKPEEILKDLAGADKVETDITTKALKEPFRINPGETQFSVADRLARLGGFTVTDTPEGKAKLTKAGTKRMAGGFVEGRNVKDASAVFDLSKQHSTTKVKAQAPDGYGPEALEIEREAKNDTITRERIKIIVPPERLDKDQARDRAKWHRDRAAGKGTTCEIEMPGWRDSAGRLLECNLLAWTEIPYLGLRQDMTIEKIRFKQSNDGTTASISLVDPRAYGGKKGRGAKSGKQWDVGKAGADDPDAEV